MLSVLALVTPVSLTASGRSEGRIATTSSCAAAVKWNGTLYLGNRVYHRLRLTKRLGRGTLPACRDTPSGTASPTQRVSVVAIANIPARVAVAVAGDAGVIYEAPGYFPQLPGTPLHRAVYGVREDVPNERGNDCDTAQTKDLTARVLGAPFGWLSVELRNVTDLPRKIGIFPDVHTTISYRQHGLPHVEPGDMIHATVLVCRHPNDAHFLKLVATRLKIGN
jgi:hypothetical protein